MNNSLYVSFSVAEKTSYSPACVAFWWIVCVDNVAHIWLSFFFFTLWGCERDFAHWFLRVCIQTSWRHYYFCEVLPTHSNMHNIHCVRHFTTRLLIYSPIFKENGISFFLDVCFLAKLFKRFHLWVKIHFFNFFTNVSRICFFKLVNFAVIVLITIYFK